MKIIFRAMTANFTATHGTHGIVAHCVNGPMSTLTAIRAIRGKPDKRV